MFDRLHPQDEPEDDDISEGPHEAEISQEVSRSEFAITLTLSMTGEYLAALALFSTINSIRGNLDSHLPCPRD